MQPDIILTDGATATVALQRETRTIPIVFTGGGDPVVSGIVSQLNQPGGRSMEILSLPETAACSPSESTG